MATRAVNKTAKEGEQNARLLLSRGALSAMAIFRRGAFPSVRRWRCTAPYPAARPSRASTLSFVLLTGGRSPSPAFGAVFFCGESGSCLVRGESKRSSMARSSRMRSRATGSGNILARCVPGRSTMAKCSRDAFPSVRRWRDCALMRSWPDWQWQYTRAVRSRASIRGNFFTPCIPKAASDGKIASSRQDSHAMHPKTGWPWQDMRAMHPKCPANRRWRIHRAKILPGRGPFRCTGPSNHARRADLAVRRSAKPPERPRPRRRRTVRAARARSPGPRNTAQEAAPSSPPGQQVPPAAPAVPPPLFADSVTCGDSIHAATAPLIRQAALAQRRAIFPTCGACLLCSWQMRSAYKRQAEPLLRDYFVMVA